MGIGLELAEEASATHSRRHAKIEGWLRDNPDKASEFWDYVRRVRELNGKLFPTMYKLIDALGGPPGGKDNIRRFINESLSKPSGR